MLLPLCVDLDGTLIETDVTREMALLFLKRAPWKAFLLPWWLLRGRAYLKARLGERVSLRIDQLPYHKAFLAFLREEHYNGRPLILATAADQKIAQQVAEYLGIFQEIVASNGKINQRAHQKAKSLVERFGEKGFAYAGNSKDDLAVWPHAEEVIAVAAPSTVLQKLNSFNKPSRVFL